MKNMAKYDDMYMIVIDCICVLIKMIFHMFLLIDQVMPSFGVFPGYTNIVQE